MQLFKGLTGMMTSFLLVSCVTINIYFPAAAAEKAADRIIEDVWGKEAQTPKQSKPVKKDDRQSQAEQRQNLFISVLDWAVSPAEAAANIDISSPAIRAIKNKMKARFESLRMYFDNGAIGLTGNGLITIRNAKAIPLKDRNKVKALVAQENKDREALYAEIARSNGHPEWKADIQATFARRWIDKAAAGWWYQSGGRWQQK